VLCTSKEKNAKLNRPQNGLRVSCVVHYLKKKKLKLKRFENGYCLRYVTANALHTNKGCVLYILMMAMGYNFIYMMDTAAEISEM
jgi:hypothetical protein